MVQEPRREQEQAAIAQKRQREESPKQQRRAFARLPPPLSEKLRQVLPPSAGDNGLSNRRFWMHLFLSTAPPGASRLVFAANHRTFAAEMLVQSSGADYFGSLSLLPELIKERFAPPHEAIFVVEFLGEPVHALLELLDGHVLGHEIHIEQGAKIPSAGLQKPALAEKSCIERGAGKGSKNRDLNIIERNLHGKVEDLLEDRRRLSIQTKDETAVDGYPLFLNSPQRLDIGI